MTTAPRPFRGRLSRAVEVQEAVKDIILRRRLAAGDPLPTESELIEELGISRNSVREALKALQAVGIVDIRHGFGMFVGRMSLSGLVDELAFHGRITMQDGRNDLGHLIEIREILETGLVQRLIDRHQEADLSPVDVVMEQMEAEALVGDVSPDTDRLFHDVLYRPLGNPLVGQLLGAFWDVYHQLRDNLGSPDESPADVVRRHRDIHAAVAAGDKAAAIAAVHAHFEGVRNRLGRLRRLGDPPHPSTPPQPSP
ncbi:DNA-binding FadR family transcriptional regulator [Streptosporangium album]|uniref:DNA-binding FadR family transcriptional regulator n=1 Tax=Streptosporangium album TaxID=47479 RepID=A0A7W7WB17_9ACTN|nr:FCD domain-containing protein [Streptosporangium album]MBB4941022.1 DNA-binding FadR family transcriptional regulator [Streptosporangium album]